MEIPKSLISAWKEVSKDGDISAADFEKLKQAAAPNKLDSEFDESEVKFLQTLKSDLDKNGGAKGKIPVDGVKFTAPDPSKISLDSIKVPENLKETWNRVTSDGNLTKADYRELVNMASPTFDDNELSPEEHSFLKSFRETFASTGVNQIELVKPEEKKPDPVKQQEKTETKTTETKTDEKVPVEKTSEKEQKQLLGLNDFKAKTDEELQKLHQVKNILDMVSDDPDLAKLKVIVEKRLGNTQEVNKYNYNVNAILTNTDKTNPQSLQIAKKELDQEFKKLPESLRNNQQIKQIHQEALAVIDEAIGKVKPVVSNKQTGNTQPKNEDGVPDTLRKVWESTIADGVFDADDLEKLLQTAAPNLKDEEFSQEELDFIKTVRSALLENGGELHFKTANNEEAKPKNDIPKSLQAVWDKVIADGKLTTDDFEEILQAAAPNKINSEFDDEELDFIARVRASLEENNGIVSFVDAPDPDEHGLQKSDFGPVPKTLNAEWEKIKEKGSINQNDFNSLILAAAPNDDDTELDETEFQFLNNIKRKLDSSDGPVRLTMKETSVVQNNKNVDSDISEFGKVPASLKSAWKEISASGVVNYADMNKLVDLSAPNQLDSELSEDEAKFLQALKEKLDSTSEGFYKFNKSESQTKAPVLLNWPGYNKQTREALSNAYQGSTVGSSMPLLPPRIASQVANSFGAGNVTEMQSMVGAKPDGKFGPETYFRAKAFIANELNRTDDPQSIAMLGRMLQALGNDPEVLKMKALINGSAQ